MVVLKGVPALLSPELLFALARMGHGDEIVLADVNFPSSSICRGGPEEIRADGLGIPQLLEAVLQLLPLDTYVQSPVRLLRALACPLPEHRGTTCPDGGGKDVCSRGPEPTRGALRAPRAGGLATEPSPSVSRLWSWSWCPATGRAAC
uniref:L-fucose mutarotase n=1 Tax=Bos taurus TaxID=9913 RepID=A0ABI0NXB4_BOVIN